MNNQQDQLLIVLIFSIIMTAVFLLCFEHYPLIEWVAFCLPPLAGAVLGGIFAIVQRRMNCLLAVELWGILGALSVAVWAIEPMSMGSWMFVVILAGAAALLAQSAIYIGRGLGALEKGKLILAVSYAAIHVIVAALLLTEPELGLGLRSIPGMLLAMVGLLWLGLPRAFGWRWGNACLAFLNLNLLGIFAMVWAESLPAGVKFLAMVLTPAGAMMGWMEDAALGILVALLVIAAEIALLLRKKWRNAADNAR